MLVISDLHWRCDTPAWRKEENYTRDVLRPMLGACLDTGEAICVAGDVFHRAADFPAVYDLYTFLDEQGAKLYAVPGQHDMVNHNNVQFATGFNLLVEAGLIIQLDAECTDVESLNVYGMGWGDDFPLGGGDILIAHASISHGKDVIPGATTAEAFANKTRGFDFKFTGDNHKRFSLPEKGLYNAGCFHRMSIDLENQPPAAWRVRLARNRPVEEWLIPSPKPLVNLAHKLKKEKGTAIAGKEFAEALSKARSEGGGEVFLATLKEALATSIGEQQTILAEVIKKCEESEC
jgi:hypothetical protein